MDPVKPIRFICIYFTAKTSQPRPAAHFALRLSLRHQNEWASESSGTSPKTWVYVTSESVQSSRIRLEQSRHQQRVWPIGDTSICSLPPAWAESQTLFTGGWLFFERTVILLSGLLPFVRQFNVRFMAHTIRAKRFSSCSG